uniref:EGF domain-specific O-linked N-acetylglucosamine (GlcNAc) transferase n=1 Tax=Oryzias sinensis TaxID=183150 RepID=A0A8C7ZHS8_9TELE
MVLLVALGLVFPVLVVATEMAENSNHKPTTPLFNYSGISLPPEHIPYFLHNNKRVVKQCRLDPLCPFQDALQDLSACWGYEKNCDQEKRFSYPACTKADSGWYYALCARELFWKQADFGYVGERLSELKTLCKANNPEDSSLRCTRHARFCRATNLYLDLRQPRRGHERFQEDFIQMGEIGGHCKLNKQALAAEGDHKSPLQSWYAELQTYTELDFHPMTDGHCDIIIEKPTVFMKLDAGVNMYHHFCDFVNLYISQHINNSFSSDILIVMWDTSFYGYGDLFSETWRAFTDYDIVHLKTYDSKRVCFKDSFFSLLPRMRYGLFYNTPLVSNCYTEGMFRAFSQHVLHRLHIHQNKTKVRETLNPTDVSRFDMIESFLHTFQKMKYVTDVPFLKQLDISHNSDIFIGMHGAGLTHLLFLPDWGVIFELYNCQDESCYRDLARLRGIRYVTWQKMDKVLPQDKVENLPLEAISTPVSQQSLCEFTPLICHTQALTCTQRNTHRHH